jgi:hypothetical protein
VDGRLLGRRLLRIDRRHGVLLHQPRCSRSGKPRAGKYFEHVGTGANERVFVDTDVNTVDACHQS